MADFKWAHGQNANIKEPLAGLIEKGWQYADIPTASNFNWLFNELQKELDISKAAVKELKESSQKLNADLKKLRESTAVIKNTAESALTVSEINDRELDVQKNIFYQLCALLKVQESDIRRYHSSFPIHPWPTDGVHSVRTMGESVAMNNTETLE